MPGVKSVNWNDSNKVKALDALLNYCVIRIDDEVAEAVAMHVGGGCKARAIKNLLENTKRRFVPQNGAPASLGTPKQIAVKRASPVKLKQAEPAKDIQTTPKISSKPEIQKRKREDFEDTKCRTDSKKRTPVSSKKSFATKNSTASKSLSRDITPIKTEDGDDSATTSPTPFVPRATPRKFANVNYLDLNGGGEPSEEDSEPTDMEYTAAKVEAFSEDDDDQFIA